MNSNLLGMLGLARRGGMLAAGEEPAQEAAAQKNARLLLLASDAAANTERRIRRFAEEGACLWTRAPFTKAELGSEIGRASCAILAITDIGMAAAIARRLAETDAPRYGELADKLDVKAKRAAERRAERRSREKAEKRARRAAPTPAGAEKEKPPAGERKRSASGSPSRAEPPAALRPGTQNRTGRSFGKKPAVRGSRSGRPGGERRGFGSPSGGQKFSHSSHAPSRPFAGSRPVKKGKGSFRRKPGEK